MNHAQINYALEQITDPRVIGDILSPEITDACATTYAQLAGLNGGDQHDLHDAHILLGRVADQIALHAILSGHDALYERASVVLRNVNAWLDSWGGLAHAIFGQRDD